MLEFGSVFKFNFDIEQLQYISDVHHAMDNKTSQHLIAKFKETSEFVKDMLLYVQSSMVSTHTDIIDSVNAKAKMY